jgi:hypothetical protein
MCGLNNFDVPIKYLIGFLKCCRFSEDLGAIHVSGLHYGGPLHVALKILYYF